MLSCEYIEGVDIQSHTKLAGGKCQRFVTWHHLSPMGIPFVSSLCACVAPPSSSPPCHLSSRRHAKCCRHHTKCHPCLDTCYPSQVTRGLSCKKVVEDEDLSLLLIFLFCPTPPFSFLFVLLSCSFPDTTALASCRPPSASP